MGSPADRDGWEWVAERDGLQVVWDGRGQYEVWALHPAGRWVRLSGQAGPPVDEAAVEWAEQILERQRWRQVGEGQHLDGSWEAFQPGPDGDAARRQVGLSGVETRERVARGTNRAQIGVPVDDSSQETGETPAQTALRVVHGDRQRDYGHPADNFTHQAVLWSAWLQRKYGLDVSLDVEDVAMLNVLQKVSRQANRPKHDNLADIVGYLEALHLAEQEIDLRAREAAVGR